MFKKRLQLLVGDSREFPLQDMMYHGISLIIAVTLLLKAFIYLSTTLHEAFIGCAITSLMEFGFYYLSRVKRKYTLAATLTAAQLTTTQVLIHMFNGGVHGNVLLLSAISLFLIIIIVPRSQRLMWLVLNMAVVLGMLIWEYKAPFIVKQHYANREEAFMDLGVTYITVVVLLFLGLTVLVRGYSAKKALADDQARKLKELNDEKDKLFSIISHDLSAPMASVKQYLDLMQVTELDEEERKVIEKDLTRSLGDAQYLLHNLLLWAKSQMQVNHVQLDAISVNHTIQEVVRLFRQRAAKKGIVLHVEDAEDYFVLADKNMLSVVMRNVLNNAVKFTHLEGRVEISTKKEGDHCIISVVDNGIGITREKQGRIFSLNVLSTYGTANEKGTGLGLLLSREFVERQKGKIWFKSKPWEGTTFFVSLPMAPNPLARQASSPPVLSSEK